MSAHWPRFTVCQGWVLGRSSGSSINGNTSHQLSQTNLGDTCQSWSILWWWLLPVLPRPPGCFQCLPVWPWSGLTWPQSFRVFRGLDSMLTAEMKEPHIIFWMCKALQNIWSRPGSKDFCSEELSFLFCVFFLAFLSSSTWACCLSYVLSRNYISHHYLLEHLGCIHLHFTCEVTCTVWIQDCISICVHDQCHTQHISQSIVQRQPSNSICQKDQLEPNSHLVVKNEI